MRSMRAGAIGGRRSFLGSSSAAERVGQPAQPSRECARWSPARHGRRAAQRLRHGLVVAQIAIAFVLLAAPRCLVPEQVMAVSTAFARSRYHRSIHAHLCAFSVRIRQRVAVLDRMREQTGNSRVAARNDTNIPLSGDNGKTRIRTIGYVAGGRSLHGHYHASRRLLLASAFRCAKAVSDVSGLTARPRGVGDKDSPAYCRWRRDR